VSSPCHFWSAHQDGLIATEPPKVEYALTPFGRSLAKALGPLCVWGTEHMGDVERISLRRQASLDVDAR
jgi:DNA-binding HxlR family transcriptional regulator